MRPQTEKDYKERMLKVLVHIQQHLDEALSLDDLAAMVALNVRPDLRWKGGNRLGRRPLAATFLVAHDGSSGDHEIRRPGEATSLSLRWMGQGGGV